MSWFYLGIPYADNICVPLYLFRIPAGFPSPAADHVEEQISLNEPF